MKPIILTVSLLALCYTSFAQNASLTKEETINYLNKKINETLGLDYTISTTKFTVVNTAGYTNGIVKTDKGVRITWIVSASDNTARINSNEFNPQYIESVSDYSCESCNSLGWISVKLTAKVCLYKDSYSNNTSTTDNASFIFFNADPETRKKIARALLHLRDLYKAEDDPFGD